MNAAFFYQTVTGRTLLKVIQKTHLMALAAGFLRTPFSCVLIPWYIHQNQLDMKPFHGQHYLSFAGFFARKKADCAVEQDPNVFISPCDGLLTVYPISQNLRILMKGSRYRLKDLISDPEIAQSLHGGYCFVFRLQAKDYHHFCCFDDAALSTTIYIPGQLHSVQPIACDTVPVFRLNRRWWSVLDTAHFGTAVQIEVGAMLVGGVRFAREQGRFRRGEEMGNFELAGSTIVLLVSESVRKRLHLYEPFVASLGGYKEVPVRMGQGIGVLKDE